MKTKTKNRAASKSNFLKISAVIEPPVRERKGLGTTTFLILLGLAVILAVVLAGAIEPPHQTAAAVRQVEVPATGPLYRIVPPGTHPGLLFSAEELPKLKSRARGESLAAEAYRRVVELAASEAEGNRRARKLAAMALVYQIDGDREMGRRAVELLKEIITGIEPFEFYREVNSDFFATDIWPMPLACAWDWLYELLDGEERSLVLKGLEGWCKALYEHTEAWWWREASYNCGAIPVGALGFACTAIQAETNHPEFEKWFSSAVRRIQRNYFPTAWRENGICYEGPCYAQYHKGPTQFGEALRRTGGPDIIASSGAVNAMSYQMFQWMPQGGCGPIGDNTGYGRRVFEANYLLGLGELKNGPGLWTFLKYTDRERLDPLITFLWYPEDLEPVSPGQAGVPTSRYFEITRNRAGYVYSRSEWDNEQAHWFTFVTRWDNANHQHYDMNSFLFTAFGEQFATHENIYPYSHEHHGVDFEHNLVVVDSGGMPARDRSTSAGDDCSLGGLLTGLGLGHFADYVRGDAKLSYADHSDPATLPAERADRTCLFVKQGPNPYLVMIDDIQKSGLEHNYHWQWYTPAKRIVGAGTLANPMVIEGERASCAVGFLVPAEPELDFQIVHGGSERSPIELGLIRVHQHGVRVRFVAVAAAWEKEKGAPVFKKGPAVKGSSAAVSLVVEGSTFTDLIVWQPEEVEDCVGVPVTCGKLATDGLLSLVRTDLAGRVTGYLLGEGRNLSYGGRLLAVSEESWSVSADSLQLFAGGRRRAREDLPPLPAAGRLWLPGPQASLFADDRPVELFMAPGRMALVGSGR